MSTEPRLARFGTFDFDLDSLELRRQGIRVPIEPQPAKALAILLQNAGEIVSRETLKQALWKDDVHVDFDRGLAYVIGQVRSALGDSADNPRFVETLPKRGFRFIAPTFAADAATVVGPTEPHAKPVEKPRTSWARYIIAPLVAVAVVAAAAVYVVPGNDPVLAVAIFDNETGQPQYDQFTAGMADAVIVHLDAVDLRRVGVIGNARSLRMPRSARDLTQIKSETGATFILISVLQTKEAGVSLLSQLIRLSDGRHVWVKRFDRRAGDLNGLEAEVLAAVESGVRVHLLGEPAPSPTPATR